MARNVGGRARAAGIAVALVAALVTLALALRHGDRRGRRAGPSPPDGGGAAAGEPADLAAVAPADAADAPAPREPVDPGAAEAPHVVAGVVELRDADGARVRVSDRSLDLFYEEPGVSTGVEVALVGERFQLPASPGVVVSAEPLEQDGRVAFLEGAAERIVPPEGPLVLRYRLPPALVLDVVDGRTGRPLTGVDVTLACPDPRRASPALTLAAGASAPVPIRGLRDAGELWVGAPGYAWREVPVDPRGGGTVRVALAAGGALVVAVRERRLGVYGWLEVGPLGDPEHSLALQPTTADEPNRIEGLPPGDHVVRLVTRGRPRLSDWTVATVRAGRTTAIELAFTPGAAYRLVEVRGLVELPVRVHAPDVELELLPAEDGYRRAEVTLGADELVPTPEGLAFEAVLRPGRYGWAIDAFGVRGEVVVTADEEQELRLRVPPIARVTVALEGAQPADLAAAYLTWTSRAGARPLGVTWSYVDLEGAAEATFPAPLGPLVLDVTTETHPDLRLHVDVAGAEVRVPVRLPAATGLRLLVRDARTRRPLEPFVDVIPAGHGGHVIDWGEPDGDDHAWTFVDRPGRYRVAPSHVWGYAPFDPVEIEVAEGVMTPVELDLEPAAMRRP